LRKSLFEASKQRSISNNDLPRTEEILPQHDHIVNSRTWLPELPLTHFLIPQQARLWDYGDRVRRCINVTQLAVEWFGTSSEVGSRDLEERWGEGKPNIPHGGSWRSPKLHVGKNWTSLYSSMKIM